MLWPGSALMPVFALNCVPAALTQHSATPVRELFGRLPGQSAGLAYEDGIQMRWAMRVAPEKFIEPHVCMPLLCRWQITEQTLTPRRV